MKRLMRYLLLLCCLAGLDGRLAAAPQDPDGHLPFRSYGREEGLGNLRVNLLLQDHGGFIWVGTDDGLYRFDGQHFRPLGVAQGLPSPLVNALTLDADDQLWVGTDRGPARWDGERFQTAFVGYPAGLKVEDIAAGPDQQLWLATRSGIFIGKDGHFSKLAGGDSDRINTLAPDPDGQTMWIGARHAVWRWRRGAGWARLVDGPFISDKEELDQLLVTPDHRVWARTSRQHYVLEPGATRFSPLAGIAKGDSYLSRMHYAPNSGLWLPTEKGVYFQSRDAFKRIGLDEGLPTSFARSVLIDREGTLWVGSLGLHRIIGQGVWVGHTPQQGLPGNVWSILRNRHEQLVVGTGAGVALAEQKHWRMISGTEGYQVRSMVQTADGGLIFGGEPYGLVQIDASYRHSKALPVLPGRDGRRVLSLLLDQSQQLWIGTLTAGLLHGTRAPVGWRFESVIMPGGRASERVAHILEDAQGTLWVAGDEGLACKGDQGWHRYGPGDGLASHDVLYVSRGTLNTLWLAYRDKPGLVTHLKAGRCGDKLTLLNAPKLPAQDIYLLGEDASARLWVGNNAGVTLATTPLSAKPGLIRIGIEDGLVDEDLNAMALLAEPDGMVWLGTRGGMAQFRPDLFRGNPPPPKIAILDARLGEQVLGQTGQTNTVSHDNNTLMLAFAGLSFVDPAGVRYQVRLLGLESIWRDTNTRELRYPGLSPGEYQLEIRARFRDGGWGPISLLRFDIRPPWWQTWWARTLAVVLLVLLAQLGLRLRLRALRKRTAMLENQVSLRTAELAAANEALRNQSLTDPLTGLHNRRYINQVLPDVVAQANRELASRNKQAAGTASGQHDLVFALVDVDHFKSVNDEFGHAAGDKVLQEVARLLQDSLRESDIIARWGGEEFLLIARQTDHHEVGTLMERVRSRIEGHIFTLDDGRQLRRTISIGFAAYPFVPHTPQALGWEVLIEVADQCLYLAKNHGRNAWLGVEATANIDTENLQARISTDLNRLLLTGQVSSKTSLPDFRL